MDLRYTTPWWASRQEARIQENDRPTKSWDIAVRDSINACAAALERVGDAPWVASLERPGYFDRSDGLHVIVSAVQHRAHGRWLHVSYAREDRLPSHQDTLDVRAIFLDPKWPAASIWPPEDEYVNLHEFCLHLWQQLDGKRWPPDMRWKGQV